MPKLNVQQNNQNVIQAFRNALAIGNLKGIIASDGNHNFSAAGSNRNLLDNPWWGLNEVINQRGNTSGQTTHDAYSIDRWKMSYGSALGSWSIAEDGITITAASGTYALFGQVLANKDAIEGKTVTASVLLGDGTIVSGTIPSFTWATNPIAYEHNGLQLRFLASGTFRVNVTGGNSKTIRAVKLELGSVSTLANDAPPEYTDELNKCRYYFRRIGLRGDTGTLLSGAAALATNALFYLDGPMNNNTGSISFAGAFTCNDNAVTGFDHKVTLDGIRINALTSGLTVNGSVVLRQTNVNAHIDISHDL